MGYDSSNHQSSPTAITPLNLVGNCHDRHVQELYVRSIFRRDDFRKSMLDTLSQFPPGALDYRGLLDRLHIIVAKVRESGLGNDNPEYAAELDRLGTFVQGLGEINELYSRHSTTEGLRKYSWPDPSKGKRFGGNLYDTVPVAAKDPILNKQTKIASGGGCLNYFFIDHLTDRGYNYIFKETNLDPDTGAKTGNYDPEAGPRHQGSCNWGVMFNAPAFAQIADIAFAETPPDLVCTQVSDSPPMYTDPFRMGVNFPSLDAFYRNSEAHARNTRDVLMEAEVFLAFLGNNEGGRYLPDGRVISSVMPDLDLRPLFRPVSLTVQENVDALSHFIDVVTAHNPSIKFILGITPTPMLATWKADSHIVESDLLGKSVLRVATEEVVRKYEHVYYFPSLEAGRICCRDPFGEDGRHATDEALNNMADAFEARFAEPAGKPPL